MSTKKYPETYTDPLREGNDDREFIKQENIKSVIRRIDSWKPDINIPNDTNNNKTNFEKITTRLKELLKISGKQDLFNKIGTLRKGNFSLDEIGIALSTYYTCSTGLPINLHKQTVSRIVQDII